MLSATAVWLSALLLSSTSVASPLLAESINARSPSIRTNLVSKAYLERAVTVPSPVQAGISSTCAKYYQAQAGDQCTTVATKYSISVSIFESWNPAVGSGCGQLMTGYYYCVAGGSSTGTSNTALTSSVSSTGAINTALSSGTDATSGQGTTSGGTCASAMPGYVDPNAGPIGNEQLVCTVTTADYGICSAAKPCSGNATFYTVSLGNTACGGGDYADSDKIAALSSDYVMGLLSSGDPPNPYCNSTITVTYNGKSVPGITVVDKCAGCKSIGHVDLSHGSFDALGADENAGHVEITWNFDST